MAGIGFKLQKLFQEDYYSSRVKAYAFAGLVTSGPWLIVIATISILQWLITGMAGLEKSERSLFALSVSYSFIFSQIIFGLQQFVVTRYIADLFYSRQFDKVFPAFVGMSKVTIAIATVLYACFFFLSPLPFAYKGVLFILFLTINLIWVMFLFLSAAKYYQAVAYSFLAGGTFAVAATFLAGKNIEKLSVLGMSTSLILLAAFTLGLVITLFSLLFAMFATFPDKNAVKEYEYLSYMDKFPALLWIGFLYNVGIWVCNWIIWFGEGGLSTGGTFIYNPLYDTAIFWSYLTIIPALTIFVVSVETRFYERYKTFFGFINRGGTLEQIQKAKTKMIRVMKEELQRLARTQAVFTIFFIFSASYVTAVIGIQPEIISIFQVTSVGAFSNVMMLVIILLLLYFEDQKGALWTTILFVSLNTLLTAALLPFGMNWYGFSFALGSTISFFFAGSRLLVLMKDVDYHIFRNPEVQLNKRRGDRFTRIGNRLNEKFSR